MAVKTMPTSLLVVLLCVVFPNGVSWVFPPHQHRHATRFGPLRNDGSGSSAPPPPGSRLQRLMDEAKRLREEATAMEVKESNEEPVAGGGDTSDRAVTASATAQQFSALFPAARKLVADALAAPPRREPASPATTATDSAQSPSSSTATTAAAGAGGKTNGTYVSILSDRGEAAARKALVDKISGEGARSSDGATDGTVAPGRNFFFLEDDEVGGVDGDDDVGLSRLQRQMESATPADLPALLLPEQVIDLFGQPNDERLVLPKVDRLIATARPWLLRQLLRLGMGALFDSTDRADADSAYLEVAYVLTVLQFIEDFQERIDVGDDVGEVADDILDELGDTSGIRFDVYLRADYLRYRCTGEVPSFESLYAFLQVLEPKDLERETNLWRLVTLQRLLGITRRARKESKLIWGIDTAEATMEALGGVGGLPAAAGTSGAPQQAAISDVVDVLEAALLRQGSSSTAAGKSLLAMAKALNATYAKISETNSYLEDAVVSDMKAPLRTSPSAASAPGGQQMQQQQDAQLANSTVSLMDDADITSMTAEQLREYFDLGGLSERFKMELQNASQGFDEVRWTSTAERFIAEYFDTASRTDGAVISREGAGRFQSEILRDVSFVVSNVKMYQGACIFEGRFTGDQATFVQKIAEKFAASPMAQEVGYTVMINERYPSLDAGFEQAAIESFIGTAPAVVVFPKSWTPVLSLVTRDSGRRFWRNAIASAGVFTSGAFAAGALDVFNPSGMLMTTGVFPDDFLSMAFVPLFIHYTASISELLAGARKGVELTTLLIPSFTLPTFASRSTYTSMPANRDDLFDIAAVGLVVPLLLSFGAFAYGLQLTTEATSEALATFPTVPLGLLKTNTILAQMLSRVYPDIFQPLLDANAAAAIAEKLPEEVAAAVTTAATAVSANPTVHLHWLAIAGGLSLTAYILQLIPTDNSSGSKLSFSVLGIDGFAVLSSFVAALRFVFLLPMFFFMSSSSVITPKRLLFDYWVTSQLAGSLQETQVCKDMISPVSEGRVLLYTLLVSLLFFALVPFGDIASNTSAGLSAFAQQLQSLSGSSGTATSIF